MKAISWIGISAVALAVGAAGIASLANSEVDPAHNDDVAHVPSAAELQHPETVSKDGFVKHIYVGERIPESELEDVLPEELKKINCIRMESKLDMSSPEVKWSYRFVFENINPILVAELECHLKVKTPGLPTREMYVHFTRVPNATYGLYGSLFPFENSDFTEPVVFSMPGNSWLRSTRFEWSPLKARKFKKPLPKNTIPGMAQMFYDQNESVKDFIETLKENPELNKLEDKEYKVNTTMLAFAFGNEEVIRHIMANGGDGKSRDSRGAGIMHYAARGLDRPAVKLAAEYGGSVKDRNICGLTPLHYAGLAGMPYHVAELVKMGGDPNAMSTTDQSPGHFALLMYNTHTIEEFFKAGADKKYTNREGYGYMHMAIQNKVMLEKLHQLGLSMEMQNPINGETPLLTSARYNAYYGIEFFLENGANEKAVDKQGRDMYELSKLSNTLRTDEFFRENVAEIKARKGKKK